MPFPDRGARDLLHAGPGKELNVTPAAKRKIMLKKKVIAIMSFALLVALVLAHQAMAQDAATTYTKMAPIDEYLMADQGAEVALARSAAPESISRDAEVQVLRRHG